MNNLISMSVIYEAMNADEIAVSTIITHYRGYIRYLSRRPCSDTLSFEHLYIDEDMQRRLESRLIYAVITKFKILKEE